MLGWIKLGGALLIVGFLIAAGWQVHRWRTDAARAKSLESELLVERLQRHQADRAREKVSQELAEAQSRVRIEIREVIKNVPKYIDRGNCQLNVAGVQSYNRLRGVPGPAQ